MTHIGLDVNQGGGCGTPDTLNPVICANISRLSPTNLCAIRQRLGHTGLGKDRNIASLIDAWPAFVRPNTQTLSPIWMQRSVNSHYLSVGASDMVCALTWTKSLTQRRADYEKRND